MTLASASPQDKSMARNKKSKSGKRRDINSRIAKRSLHFDPKKPQPVRRKKRDLTKIEDRRSRDLTGRRKSPKDLFGDDAIIDAAPTVKKGKVNYYQPRLAFERPRTALTCVRRKAREQVIHATGKAGAGNARPKFNELSKVSCKKGKK